MKNVSRYNDGNLLWYPVGHRYAYCLGFRCHRLSDTVVPFLLNDRVATSGYQLKSLITEFGVEEMMELKCTAIVIFFRLLGYYIA